MCDVHYFVNKDKGVVVCKITDVRCDVCHKMEKRDIGFSSKALHEMLVIIPNDYVGKAKCSGDDVFDEEKGKAIAYKRAVQKANKAKRRFVGFITNLIKEDYETTTKKLNILAQQYEKAEKNAVDGLAAIMETINK